MIVDIRHKIELNKNGVKYDIGLGVVIEDDVSDNQVETAIDQQMKAMKYQIKKLLFPKRSDMENSR